MKLNSNEIIGLVLGVTLVCAVGVGLFLSSPNATPEQMAARAARACPETVAVKELLAKRSEYTAVRFSDDHVEILYNTAVSVGTLFCKKDNDYDKK